jgi:hypothetical protein
MINPGRYARSDQGSLIENHGPGGGWAGEMPQGAGDIRLTA